MAWRQGFWLKRKVCLPGSYPFRQSLRLCHLPQGDGFSGGGKLCGNAERRPPGGAGERSETEGVLHASILVLPRSAALPQKAALQMPFPSMTPPVKMRLERSAERDKREILNNNSAATTTTAASGGNREELLGQRPARCECRPRHDADAGCRNPEDAARI